LIKNPSENLQNQILGFSPTTGACKAQARFMQPNFIMWFKKANQQGQVVSLFQAGEEQVSVHHLFEKQAASTPAATAIICGGATMSYLELRNRSDVLAADLRALGVAPGDLVGVFMERSAGLIVALLAVLKAGAGYVPLDPAYPRERIAYMLCDTRCSVLITEEHLLPGLPSHQAKLLILEQTTRTSAEHRAKPFRPVPASELAYVIYTSGSTGKPKGVQVSHSALVNHSQAMLETYRLTTQDRVLQFASISFDVAAEEIFPTLLGGAALVLHPQRASIPAFLDFVEEHALTVLNLPTSFWQELVFEMERTARPLPCSVRLVVVGNEKALVQTYRQWRQLVGERVEWMNAYGLTETTITSTIYNPREHGPDLLSTDAEMVPIGRPIRNVQMFLLDSNLKPVPQGQPGELYVGGAGLALGYLNLPELTKAKFIPHPLHKNPGARLFKTGDRGCLLPDGNFHFLGRVDEQIKIRGFRVEPAEIEAVLLKHPGVRQAAVVARESNHGENRLIAYLAAEVDAKSVRELRRSLCRELPDYMLPALFVCLESLPLLPNGKIDRKNLPEPEPHRAVPAAAFVKPRSLAEQLLARIWTEVLGLEEVSVHDNFFELGGHSLNVVQVSSRLREQLQLEVPMELFFEHQTLASLAQVVESLLARELDRLPEDEARKLNHGGKPWSASAVLKGGITSLIVLSSLFTLRAWANTHHFVGEHLAELA
jgi:amino acid adenylation domain-containing protein